MNMAAWCFQCRLEYHPDVAECVECAVPTVGHFPLPPHEVGGPDDEQLAYELHSWDGQRRLNAEEQLHRANISHGWQGPTLIVLVDDEEAVDVIIDQLSDEDPADASEAPSVDGMVAIPVGASTELQDELLGILEEEEIEHELLPRGLLLVPVEHEDHISEVFEELQTKYRGTDSFGPGVEGVVAHKVVEQIFLATSTLRKSTRDVRAGRSLVEASDIAHQMKLPFGFEAPMWRHVLDKCELLSDLITDGGDDDEVEREAAQLRELLHQYV